MVLFHPVAHEVHDAEVSLCRRISPLGSLAKPADRFYLVPGHPVALNVHSTDDTLRPGVSLLSGAATALERLHEVRLHPETHVSTGAGFPQSPPAGDCTTLNAPCGVTLITSRRSAAVDLRYIPDETTLGFCSARVLHVRTPIYRSGSANRLAR